MSNTTLMRLWIRGRRTRGMTGDPRSTDVWCLMCTSARALGCAGASNSRKVIFCGRRSRFYMDRDQMAGCTVYTGGRVLGGGCCDSDLAALRSLVSNECITVFCLSSIFFFYG